MLIRSALALLLTLSVSSTTLAQPPADDDERMYILPVYLNYSIASDATFAQQVATLRDRIGEGGPVRAGFSAYLKISMNRWDVTTEADALANLTATISTLDRMIARARAQNIPLALLVTTALRSDTDPLQRAAQDEDRRNMQWYSDNELAAGWIGYSRYARKQVRIRDLYLRALARVLANRVAQYPETIVAVAADGEAELAHVVEGPPYADYSPFTVAEFRDWLRGEGLYAAGQPYAADAFAQASRYRGDAAPNVDTNQDGHTLNGDMNTNFATWALRYFDWSLTDDPENDPKAIPVSVYSQQGWERFPAGPDGGFDPPRDVDNAPAAWRQAWLQFREMLVWRYTVDFARIMATTADQATGMTIPASRFSSYLIPADYLFGHSPENPHPRYIASASASRSTDIRPYGSAGITAFNTRHTINNAEVYFETLSNVAPVMASFGTRWNIFEWNPSYPTTTDPFIYRKDVATVERYRPHVVAPYSWDDAGHPILGTGFEVALAEMVARLRTSPWGLRATTANGVVRLTWAPPELGAPADSYVLEVGTSRDVVNIATLDIGGPSTVFEAGAPPGTYYIRVRARTGGTQSSPSNQVELRIDPPSVPPNAPSALVAATTGGTVTFNWLAPATGPRPNGYVLEVGTGPGLANLVTLPVGPSTTFTSAGVPPGTYFVRVRASRGVATSGVSNEVTITSQGGAGHCTPVAVPGVINFRAAGPLVTFEWDAPLYGAAPLGYQLEAGTAPGLNNIATLSLGPARTFTVAAPPGSYFLQLRAAGACGTSVPGPILRLSR